ncbi:unnamed protein product [Porites lobata]|uniref:Uncharacterized protein n=1 Tax=Porites lobata TaxID=104759 RepID=A0ABN8P978_9CNID|nr:unnamed protein product [Porites lobata]
MDTTPLFTYPANSGFSGPDATLCTNIGCGETTARRVRISSEDYSHTKIVISSNNTPKYWRMFGAYATARTPGATGARRQDGAQVLTRVLVPSCGKLNSRTFSEESGTDFPQDERNARVS